MNEQEALTRIKTGNFNGGHGFDMQLLVDTVGIIGEMFKSGQISETVINLKEQEPKTPIHIHKEYPEHDWKTDKDGNIDKWGIDYEFHNGPVCKRCGYGFCMHCKPNGWNEKSCVIDYYQCPKCGERILKNRKNIEHCVNCGQAVKWNA